MKYIYSYRRKSVLLPILIVSLFTSCARFRYSSFFSSLPGTSSAKLELQSVQQSTLEPEFKIDQLAVGDKIYLYKGADSQCAGGVLVDSAMATLSNPNPTVKVSNLGSSSAQKGFRAVIVKAGTQEEVCTDEVEYTYKAESNIAQVAIGESYGCILLNDQTVKCWGLNHLGQLGDGTTTQRTFPVSVSGLTGATQIDVSAAHSCALLSDQTVKCWGQNHVGQMGDGTNTDRLTPVSVSGGLTDVTQIVLGSGHGCALLSDQTVKCWGLNNAGQIGDGTTNQQLSAVSVVGLTGVTQITAGYYSTCALLSDQTVKCWGLNNNGQLGDGTTTSSTSPVSVVGLTDVAQVSLSDSDYACAVLTDGSVKCWGNNWDGLLGDGTTNNSLTPVSVVGLTNASEVSLGTNHSCALLSDQTVKCWAGNSKGQVGDGTLSTRLTPVSVVGLAGQHRLR